jgi:Mn2+/Fe2+ NRAMP family transporter
VAPPPRGWRRVAALGPGFLWMVSAAGSGELLFTPRVGALYGYTLLWAMVGAVVLKWFVNREIGRFAVCTGTGIVDGFAALPGPRCWAVWLILVPQTVVAVAAIAGLAGSAATALALVLPGDVRLWAVASIVASTALVAWGRYRVVEIIAACLGIGLALAATAAAVSVGPSVELAAGLVPRVAADVDLAEVVPWLGFMLSGAAGMMWYSYWIVAKGYGVRLVAGDAAAEGAAAGEVDPRALPDEDRARLRGWLRQMTLDTTVAVAGTFVVTAAFLVLGTELLRPRGLVPDEDRIAEVLGELLGGVWGPVGFWFMVAAVFVGFQDTVLSDQDGHGRLFANGTRRLLQAAGVRGRWLDEARLRRLFVLTLASALPIAVYLAAGQPVTLLAIAGVVEAAHIPLVAALTLYLGRTRLPRDLQPGRVAFACTVAAALFFLAFAVAYVVQLVTG